MSVQSDFIQVSADAKSRLAKLLAAENLCVEHSARATTAAFEPERRRLILPIWKDMSEDLYDLFVGHEVGHALFTPSDAIKKIRATNSAVNFFQYCNILEDVRIEKKQKRKYPGLRQPMIRGYADLVDRGFFGEKAEQARWDYLALVDRINIKTKLGNAVSIFFTEEEYGYLIRSTETETFEEVLALAVELFEREKNASQPESDSHPEPSDASFSENDEEESEESEGEASSSEKSDDDSDDDSEDTTSNDSSGEDADEGDSSDSEDGESDSDDEGDSSDSSGDSASEDGESDDDSSDDSDSEDGESDSDSSDESDSDSSVDRPESNDGSDGVVPGGETDAAFQEFAKELINNHAKDIVYGNLPADDVYNLNNLILPSTAIGRSYVREFCAYSKETEESLLSAYARHRKSRAKTVAFIVKEFEMRKAADVHKRAAEHSTGVINTNKLHSYKWNENIFAKNVSTPEGKNHGLVLFVDWSSSMRSGFKQTIVQFLDLIMFCDKVNIPYDAYAFTTAATYSKVHTTGFIGDGRSAKHEGDYNVSKLHDRDMVIGRPTHVNPIMGGFRLLHLISSTDNVRTRRLNGASIFSFSRCSKRDAGYVPFWMRLSMTPLNETMMVAPAIINQFRSKTKVDIVNTVFLTDGGGPGINNTWNSLKGETNAYHSINVIRDSVTRREYTTNNTDQVNILLDAIRRRTGSKVCNFYITDKNYFSQAYWSRLGSNNTANSRYGAGADHLEQFVKEGGIIHDLAGYGFDREYLLDKGNGKISESADVSSFIADRMNNSKSRKLLADFATLISVR